jgi:hypothetical protein
MVKGLDIFKEHFRAYTDRYVLIGGAACDLAMETAGLRFRATKDLDIVLCIEALDAEFVSAFWDFVRAGGYQLKQKATGGRQFYRFQKPANNAYPFMLELFSRRPDLLDLAEGAHLTPIPMETRFRVFRQSLWIATTTPLFNPARRTQNPRLVLVGLHFCGSADNRGRVFPGGGRVFPARLAGTAEAGGRLAGFSACGQTAAPGTVFSPPFDYGQIQASSAVRRRISSKSVRQARWIFK